MCHTLLCARMCSYGTVFFLDRKIFNVHKNIIWFLCSKFYSFCIYVWSTKTNGYCVGSDDKVTQPPTHCVEKTAKKMRTINHINQVSNNKAQHEHEVEIITIWCVLTWLTQRKKGNNFFFVYLSMASRWRIGHTMSVLGAVTGSIDATWTCDRRWCCLSLLPNQFYCWIFININVLTITSACSLPRLHHTRHNDFNSNLP